MKPIETFFALHPVFAVEDIKCYLSDFKDRKGSISNLLHYHHNQGRILPVRRGLYYVVPYGTDMATCPIDGFLLTSKMAKDAVLSYHTALALHGHAHSIWYLFYYLTKNRAKKPLTFRGNTYQAISIPSVLVKTNKTNFGVITYERLGAKINVTTLERTFVDILDRPSLGGSWEEIWKSFESIEYLDLDLVLEYSFLLSNHLTIAKVGYFLSTHRDQFNVADSHLKKLHSKISSKPRYIERSPRGPQKLIPSWNLIIPQSLYDHNWEEPHGNF